MADNFLYVPIINPIKFFEVDRANLPKYFTKHFDEFLFEERILDWQQPEDYCQIWQVEDIIRLQFAATFDPIIVKLLDEDGNDVITLPALIGLPNKFYPNTFSFEVEMALSGLPTGCYRLQITAGSGITQKFYISDCQYISAVPLTNSVCLEYFNSRFHADVIFETNIVFQYRLFGHLGFLDPARKDEMYRDQLYNPSLLSSKISRQFPAYLGNEYGLPDDVIDLLNRIWSCDNVSWDNKPMGLAEGAKFEFTEIDSAYPKRGLKIMLEEGINRNSRIFAIDTDTTKKLVYGIMVDKKVLGDTSNQDSSNAVPVLSVV